jgi:hypothetical protein
LWIQNGEDPDVLFDYFVDGMNYTPSTPKFEDMRNGMLQSIAASGGSAAESRCALVWQAFAALGIGDGAKATISRRNTVTVVESTAARSDCTF